MACCCTNNQNWYNQWYIIVYASLVWYTVYDMLSYSELILCHTQQVCVCVCVHKYIGSYDMYDCVDIVQ